MNKNDLYLMYRRTKVVFLPDGFFCHIRLSHVTIDVDGAPNAYGPARNADDAHGIGIDSLTSACYPPGADDPLGQEDWTDILVPDPTNPAVPYLKPDGYYISQTTLCDDSKGDLEEGKFLDATTIPYIVMPQFWIDHLGVQLGDLCVLTHSTVNKPVVAIVGDFCPFIEELGEISIKAAFSLGATDASPTEGVTFPHGHLLCRIIKKSRPADLWPLTDTKLQARLADLPFDPYDQKTFSHGQVKVDTD